MELKTLIMHVCADVDAPVSIELIDAGFEYINKYGVDLKLADGWIENGLNHPYDAEALNQGLQHGEEVLRYIQRMNRWGGEDITLIPPLTEAVYNIPDWAVLKQYEIEALWCVWVRDLLVTQADIKLAKS